MDFTRGNAAIRDHVGNGKDPHLFAYIRKAFVRYSGQMICTGYQVRPGTDRDGKPRGVIIFELIPLGAFATDDPPDAGDVDVAQVAQLSIEALRQRALGGARPFASAIERKVEIRRRSESDQTLRAPTGWRTM